MLRTLIALLQIINRRIFSEQEKRALDRRAYTHESNHRQTKTNALTQQFIKTPKAIASLSTMMRVVHKKTTPKLSDEIAI